MADIVAGREDVASISPQVVHAPRDLKFQFVRRRIWQHLLDVDCAVKRQAFAIRLIQGEGILQPLD